MINTDELGLLAGAVGLFSLLQNLCVFLTLREILRRLCVKFQLANVQEYQNPFQLRSSGHYRGDSGRFAPVRTKNQRV